VTAVSLLSLISAGVIMFALAWSFGLSLLEVFPFFLCALGLALYPLAFLHAMSMIDWLLLAAGAGALIYIAARTRRKGKHALLSELRRQFCDTHLWVCAGILLLMVWLLRGEQILEWDAYNFWGPDVKSLFYRDGFAPKFSNPAPEFGDYPPFTQFIWWWALHLAGTYQEQYIFFAHYILGAALLFSAADRFRGGKGWCGFTVSLLACTGAVILPGAACTSWFRSVYVDPVMAMLFGTVLGLTVCRDRKHPVFWKLRILAFLLCLTLVKSIGIFWAVLAIVFYALWWHGEYRNAPFLLICGGSVGLCYGSWRLFCGIMERSATLTVSFSESAACRLQELREGVFLQSGNNAGYLRSYWEAFWHTPIHREHTSAVDLSPALLILLLFAAAVVLWKTGFVPHNKLTRLIVFMAVCIFLISGILIIGQLTMFYPEQQYLDPMNAVTLMTRYCSPANMGLLILITVFAGGQAADRDKPVLPRKRVIAYIAVGAVIFSCGAYAELGRRFIYDPLDGSRLEKREMFETVYSGFLSDIHQIPLDEMDGRVLLLLYGAEFSPIVTNAASPISLQPLTLTGDALRDEALITDALAQGQIRYLYGIEVYDELSNILNGYVSDGVFQPDRLQRLRCVPAE